MPITLASSSGVAATPLAKPELHGVTGIEGENFAAGVDDVLAGGVLEPGDVVVLVDVAGEGINDLHRAHDLLGVLAHGGDLLHHVEHLEQLGALDHLQVAEPARAGAGVAFREEVPLFR